MLVELTILTNVLTSFDGPNKNPSRIILFELLMVAFSSVNPPIDSARIKTGLAKLIFLIET